MPLEVEVKLMDVDEEELLSRLEKLGITPRPADQEDFILIFDDRRMMRVRRVSGRWILTYKEKLDDERYSKYEELELEISDGETMKEILRRLFKGTPHLEIRKRRWVFEIEGVKGEFVDVNGVLRYVEFEGDEASIERAIERLGLQNATRSTKTLVKLLEERGITLTPL